MLDSEIFNLPLALVLYAYLAYTAAMAYCAVWSNRFSSALAVVLGASTAWYMAGLLMGIALGTRFEEVFKASFTMFTVAWTLVTVTGLYWMLTNKPLPFWLENLLQSFEDRLAERQRPRT